MQYQELDSDMKPVVSVEIDNDTLEVTNQNGPGPTWDEPMSDEDWFLQFRKEVIRHSDGLAFLFCIRADCVCDARQYRLAGVIPTRQFEREDQAERYLESLRDNGIDTSNHEIEEVDRWWVQLEVVPVSVSPEQARKAIDSSNWQDAEESWKRHGDWRDSAWDLQSYGTAVPVWSKEVDDDKLDQAIQEARDQALGVDGMFGFYLDRPVNRMGETGWDWLRQFQAFPGQWLNTPKTGAVLAECHDCGDEKECVAQTTIYRSDVQLCRRCIEDYVPCCKCSVLIPTEPQSWSGVEWLEHDHQYYCPSCFDQLLRGPDCPGLIRSGTDPAPSDMKEWIQNFVKAGPANWEEVKSWRFPFGSDEQDWLNTCYDAKRMMEQHLGDEFLMAFTTLAQFGQTVTLFRRTASGSTCHTSGSTQTPCPSGD